MSKYSKLLAAAREDIDRFCREFPKRQEQRDRKARQERAEQRQAAMSNDTKLRD